MASIATRGSARAQRKDKKRALHRLIIRAEKIKKTPVGKRILKEARDKLETKYKAELEILVQRGNVHFRKAGPLVAQCNRLAKRNSALEHKQLWVDRRFKEKDALIAALTAAVDRLQANTFTRKRRTGPK